MTKSCTVVPAGTTVTTLCDASWICVAVVADCWVTTVWDAAATVGGFVAQFELPVFVGSLQRSCQVSVAASVSL